MPAHTYVFFEGWRLPFVWTAGTSKILLHVCSNNGNLVSEHACAGVKILASMPGGIGRRERFILAVSLGLGLGVTLVPGWANDHLWPKTDSMSAALGGFRDAIIFTVSTGYWCATWPPCQFHVKCLL